MNMKIPLSLLLFVSILGRVSSDNSQELEHHEEGLSEHHEDDLLSSSYPEDTEDDLSSSHLEHPEQDLSSSHPEDTEDPVGLENEEGSLSHLHKIDQEDPSTASHDEQGQMQGRGMNKRPTKHNQYYNHNRNQHYKGDSGNRRYPISDSESCSSSSSSESVESDGGRGFSAESTHGRVYSVESTHGSDYSEESSHNSDFISESRSSSSMETSGSSSRNSHSPDEYAGYKIREASLIPVDDEFFMSNLPPQPMPTTDRPPTYHIVNPYKYNRKPSYMSSYYKYGRDHHRSHGHSHKIKKLKFHIDINDELKFHPNLTIHELLQIARSQRVLKEKERRSNLKLQALLNTDRRSNNSVSQLLANIREYKEIAAEEKRLLTASLVPGSSVSSSSGSTTSTNSTVPSSDQDSDHGTLTILERVKGLYLNATANATDDASSTTAKPTEVK